MQHPLARDLEHVLANTTDVWDALRGERIFITGGTGFVGTWLIESLVWANRRLNLNAQAVVLTRNPDAFRAKAPFSANDASVHLVKGSLQNFEFRDDDCAFVIHAATDQVAPSRDEPAGTFDRELNGTRRVLEYVRARGVKRLLFTSSGAVYGRQPSDLMNIPEGYAGAPPPLEPGPAYG